MPPLLFPLCWLTAPSPLLLSLVACDLGVAIVPASMSTLPFPGVAFRRIQTARHKGRLAILRSERLLHDEWATGIVGLAQEELNVLAKKLGAGKP